MTETSVLLLKLLTNHTFDLHTHCEDSIFTPQYLGVLASQSLHEKACSHQKYYFGTKNSLQGRTHLHFSSSTYSSFHVILLHLKVSQVIIHCCTLNKAYKDARSYWLLLNFPRPEGSNLPAEQSDCSGHLLFPTSTPQHSLDGRVCLCFLACEV